MIVKWLGHACFHISEGDYSIVIDPYDDGGVPGLRPVRATANEVICSHGHHDHNNTDAITIAAGKSENPFSIEKIHTFHDPEGGRLRGENTIHILSAGDVRIAHFGDLGCDLTQEQINALGHLDAVLCPVGGYYTIDAKQAKTLLDSLDAGIIIPMHYRSDSFGYDVIGTLDEFTSLYPADSVRSLDDNSVEILPGAKKEVVVPKYL